MPQFRRRLVNVPFNLAHPVWFEDPDFDVDHHLRRIAVPSPGGPEELADLASSIVSVPLDRTRPLWELWIVEGLEHGHPAVVAKMHHSAVDGVGGANMVFHLFSLSPEGDAVAPRLRTGSRSASRASWSWSPTRCGRGSSAGCAWRRSSPAPVCTGALRQYLQEGGELPDKSLVATCGGVGAARGGRGDGRRQPGVGDVRRPAGRGGRPVRAGRPHPRVDQGAKEDHQALGARMLMGWTELAAPNTFAMAARTYSRMKRADRHPPANDLVISNVPGPPFPLYSGGARLVALHPLGPISDGAGLSITVLSYMDGVGFGFIACREQMPRLWELAHHVVEATEELKKSAGKGAKGKRRVTPE